MVYMVEVCVSESERTQSSANWGKKMKKRKSVQAGGRRGYPHPTLLDMILWCVYMVMERYVCRAKGGPSASATHSSTRRTSTAMRR